MLIDSLITHYYKKSKILDITQLRELLIEKGFSISHSNLAYYVTKGNIKGFYKVKEYTKYKWYISIEDANEFVRSFKDFRKNLTN